MKKKRKTVKRTKRSKNKKMTAVLTRTSATSNPGSMVKAKEVSWSIESEAEERAEQVRREVAEYWRTAEGRAMQLRIDVAMIVLCGMKARRWAPKDLAKRTRYKLAEIRQIMSGDYGLDTEGLGELLYVLDTRVNLNIRT